MHPVELTEMDALVLVDLQNDFLPGGRLPVPRGDETITAANAYIEYFQRKRLPIFMTRDWHPPGHCSFKESGGTWPQHCVADTGGAAFAAGLSRPGDARVISKGTTVEHDAYSGFQQTNLHECLGRLGVKRLFIGGLALDVCVLNTVMDALSLGYRVFLLTDASRAVNVREGDGNRALAEMQARGAQVLEMGQLQ